MSGINDGATPRCDSAGASAFMSAMKLSIDARGTSPDALAPLTAALAVSMRGCLNCLPDVGATVC